MFYSVVYLFTLVATLATTAAAGPKLGRVSSIALKNPKSVGGVDPSKILTTSTVCQPNEDIVICATRMASTFILEQNATSDTTLANVHTFYPALPFAIKDIQGLTIDYQPSFGSCSMSVEQTDHQALLACTVSGGCSKSFTQTLSTSNTQNYGYSVGASITASGEIFGVGVSTTITTDFNQGWEATQEVTTETTTTYNLANGEVCAPTTVQIRMDCYGDIKGGQMVTSRANGQTQVMNLQTLKDWCKLGDSVSNFKLWTGADLTKFCGSLQASRVPISLYLGSGATSGTPWVVQGCAAT